MSEIGNPTIGDNIEYPYTTTVQTYKGIPFNYRLKKSHYYDIAGTMIGGQILMNGTFQSYSGLDMDYYQGTNSLMTVTVDGGTLPNRSYSQGAFGCLATVNEGTGVYTNYTKVGSTDINVETGVVSGFSTSNYLQLPTAFNPGSSSWECIFKVRTGSDVTTSQKWVHLCLGSGMNGRFGIGAAVNNSKFNVFLSSDGSTWLFDSFGTYTVLANTTYWLKIGWSGTEYYFEYSTDGTNYTRDISYTSSLPIYSPLVNGYVGIYQTSSMLTPWLGSIDLSGCQIVIDGNVWWTPLVAGLYSVLKSGYVNYTKVGSPSVNIETGVASGFSSSNYLTLGTFSPQGNTWEYYIKFTTGSSTSAQGLSTCVGSSDGCSPFYIDSGNLVAFLSSNGSNWDIASAETVMSIATNTTYKMKAEYTGTAYNWYIWQNNAWSLVKTISNSAPCYDGLTMLLGNNRGQNNPFDGTIDLSETYITIGGNTWWTPVGGISATAVGLLPSGVTDDGSAQTWNLFYKDGEYRLNTASTMSGYDWCGEIAIPAHNV